MSLVTSRQSALRRRDGRRHSLSVHHGSAACPAVRVAVRLSVCAVRLGYPATSDQEASARRLLNGGTSTAAESNPDRRWLNISLRLCAAAALGLR